MPARKLAILGSTGSVGTQALEVAERHPERLEVVARAAGFNDELLAEQVRRWKPAVISVADEDTAARLREETASVATHPASSGPLHQAIYIGFCRLPVLAATVIIMEM